MRRTPVSIEGLHLLGWGADYPDATNFLDYHFGSRFQQAVRRQASMI